MDWIGIVVTGVVGIAGIAGTFLTMRYQQRAQVRLFDIERADKINAAMRTERKTLYGRMIEITTRLMGKLGHLRGVPLDDPEFHATQDELYDMYQRTYMEIYDLYGELQRVQAEIFILGDANVVIPSATLNEHLSRHVLSLAEAVLHRASRPTRDDIDATAQATLEAHGKLIDAMRKSLAVQSQESSTRTEPSAAPSNRYRLRRRAPGRVAPSRAGT